MYPGGKKAIHHIQAVSTRVSFVQSALPYQGRPQRAPQRARRRRRRRRAAARAARAAAAAAGAARSARRRRRRAAPGGRARRTSTRLIAPQGLTIVPFSAQPPMIRQSGWRVRLGRRIRTRRVCTGTLVLVHGTHADDVDDDDEHDDADDVDDVADVDEQTVI